MANQVKTPKVTVIDPAAPEKVKLRVAAYARVSSDSADQLNSYLAQVDYYTRHIGENPDWELADIYADEGISGLDTRKRNLVDYDSPTARSVMRNAIHNLCYAVVNSNAMQGLAPGAVVKTAISPWKVGLYAADAVIAALAIGGIVWIVMRTKAEKAHPEQFKRKAPKKAKKAAEQK